MKKCIEKIEQHETALYAIRILTKVFRAIPSVPIQTDSLTREDVANTLVLDTRFFEAFFNDLEFINQRAHQMAQSHNGNLDSFMNKKLSNRARYEDHVEERL